MAGYKDFARDQARLTILKELAQQKDYRLNDAVLLPILDSFGYRQTREWLKTQLNTMQDLGAVKVHEMGTVFVAEITQDGLSHVERRSIIEGIARPSPEA